MKTLGYNRLISMENFRTPNFPLVAEILIWIVGRFDPDSNDIHTSYDTQEDRVRLIRSTAQLLALKGNIMLNTKRLYQADGFAVKELLKVVTKLYEAVQLLEEDVGRAQPLNSRLRDLLFQIQELKMSRELASQVVTKGALLYELLGKEVELREARNWGVTVQLELGNMEGGVKGAIVSTRHNIANVASLIENVAATEAALDLKIEKKKTELERNQKRLLTLMKVRPAFLEEYEKLELELQSLYQEYITRVRCHAYLEQVQEEAAQLEHEKMLQIQRETRKLMEELQSEDAQRLMLEDGDDEEGGEHEGRGTQQHTRRLRTATASRKSTIYV
ncbi:hypothetical protein AAG570_005821 [Ranatra chinensis]|uniref:Clusterin-associated protein 1 n=1 Tax=Ranatra chinensis TaxID=642074 RepID=A0ABD0XYM8_9HEMI